MSTTIEWLGQAGFVIRSGSSGVAIDPFLSEYPGRRFRAPIDHRGLAGLDLVLVTHEHADHFDVPALLALCEADPLVRFVLPSPLLASAINAGFPQERLVWVQPGDRFKAGGMTVDVVGALHGTHSADAYTFGLPEDGPTVIPPALNRSPG